MILCKERHIGVPVRRCGGHSNTGMEPNQLTQEDNAKIARTFNVDRISVGRTFLPELLHFRTRSTLIG